MSQLDTSSVSCPSPRWPLKRLICITVHWCPRPIEISAITLVRAGSPSPWMALFLRLCFLKKITSQLDIRRVNPHPPRLPLRRLICIKVHRCLRQIKISKILSLLLFAQVLHCRRFRRSVQNNRTRLRCRPTTQKTARKSVSMFPWLVPSGCVWVERTLLTRESPIGCSRHRRRACSKRNVSFCVPSVRGLFCAGLP